MPTEHDSATPPTARSSSSEQANPFLTWHQAGSRVPLDPVHGQSAAHGLSCPSGHAMVIFAITALVAPYFKGW